VCISVLKQWSLVCSCWPCAWDPGQDLRLQGIKTETDTATAVMEQVDWESRVVMLVGLYFLVLLPRHKQRLEL